ncbi:HEAT repeat domain-containing protein [Myxococcus sp. K38C18041901]|uniref:HEAT repeat domain-containing protein n=1 Tax=Myxococcus guangdongensis TaxID=2906760 RepID=UPI0020A73F02|nr:HEAT repeat domain-containing protein [Myxococcus guangdongensis]MCP3064700.1 HEAT repeat domain-containing protein [Myxococcus guangdongensis]
MSDERPDALLKSALEKIVYFEARAEQLLSELGSTREEMEHLKRELAETHQRELELRREVAELEVRSGRAQAEREESARLTQALRGERDQLMDRLLSASRLRASTQARDDEDDDLGFDLASFISQLRSEALLRGETGKGAAATVMSMKVPVRAPAVPLAEPVAKPPPPAVASTALLEPLLEGLSPVAREAQRFLQAGRLGVSAAQLAELSGQGGLGAPTDETLFGFSVRELSAQDPAARIRAAERLKALSQPAAAPALASALHAETDSAAQVALLQAFAALCREEGAQVVSPLLSSPVPEVRIAALKALLTLAPRDAAPHLAQAMKDPDRSVRRRASLLALGLEGETARRLGEEAIHDADAEVRSLAALALGAGSGENARALLLEALGDRELRVRKAAAQSLSRILGQDVSGVVALDDTHRRREIRRLATLPVKPVRARLDAPARVVVMASAPAPVVATVAPAVVVAQPVMAVVGARQGAMSTPAMGARPVAPPTHGAQAPQARASVPSSTHAVQAPQARASVPSSTHAVQAPQARAPAPPQPAQPVARAAPQPVVAPPTAVAPQRAAPAPSRPAAPAPRLSPVQAALVAMGAPAPQPATRPEEPRPVAARPSASPVETLCSPMLHEVRVAVRGRSLAELTAALGVPVELAQEAITLLSARGAVVRRGHKYFAA